ncbi:MULTISPECIES: DNA mismatch repair endonuclease MutL [unclassified Candidatus Paralachnospira]|uniref:DNA mismatch repair endonuclease MutL n=1 Tax=unclassified Candidatus Paralachnospira TaxID=3099471 RepID=UPI003F90E46C
MPNITVLSQETINQIAAGEVIDRPSSVVKELLENAIDAGATAVTIEIRDGGTTMIRITDNGCGIEKEQISTAFLRHSTSKIRTAADLLTVSSLGFRGEALSSIAAVSQVELITKTAGALTGARYQIHGGKELSLEEIGAPEGTTFLVRNLFYNTPARKKFLKSPQTEGAYISSLVERMALSRPDISLRFIQNGQTKLHTSGNHNLKDLIYMIFGREITANLLPVEADGDHMAIRGFLGKPVISRGNRTYENYFINGRYIKSGLINKAIEDGFHSYMMQHKYPFVVLHLTVEPEFLDVNVHPSKMELRFRNQEEIYELLCRSIHDTLAGKELIRRVTLSEPEEEPKQAKTDAGPEPFEARRAAREQNRSAMGERVSAVREGLVGRTVLSGGARPSGESKLPGFSSAIPPVEPPAFLKETAEYSAKPKTDGHLPQREGAKQCVPMDDSGSRKPQQEPPHQMELFEEALFTKEARKSYRFIGQVFETYWLIQYEDQFLIIDQHAAHEKVLYERMVRDLREKKIYGQQVNPPMLLSLSAHEEEILNTCRMRFEALGFEIEHFGGKEYAVHAIPANLYGITQKEILLELLDSLSGDYGKESEELILEKLASMSCKAAVKGGDRISTAEAEALIDELLNLENPYACPHGRPTIISMSRKELEKKFKRIV